MNSQKRLIGAGIATAAILVASLAVYFGGTDYNEATEYTVLQPWRGEATIVDTPGYFFKGFGKATPYPRSIPAKFEHTRDAHDKSIKCGFNDTGTAQISTFMRIELPVSTEKRLLLHKDYRNADNIVAAVHAHLTFAIQATGPVMSASENQSSRKSEFNQLVETQLTKGTIKMRRAYVELDDLTEIEEIGVDENGKKITKQRKARVQATEIVSDDAGNPIIIQKSPLIRYDLQVHQFGINGTEYDEATQRQFATKKESYLNAEKSKAQQQEEIQQRLMVEEKGRRQAAEIEAEENLKKVRAETQARQAASVAIIDKDRAVTQAMQRTEVAKQLKLEADNLKQVAQVEAETAELKKKATISAAEAKQKSIELGGGISEEKRVLAEIAAKRDAEVALALAGLKVPGVVIAGGSSGQGGNGLTENLINMTLLRGMGILKTDEPTLRIVPVTK